MSGKVACAVCQGASGLRGIVCGHWLCGNCSDLPVDDSVEVRSCPLCATPLYRGSLVHATEADLGAADVFPAALQSLLPLLSQQCVH